MKKIPLIAAVAAMCVLTSCASPGATDDTGSQDGGPVTDLMVGTSPSLSNASLYLAASDEGGQFAANGLSAEMQLVQSGAQAVPLLLNGQLQFTAADPLGALTAISKDVPLVIVASGNVAGATAEQDNTGLIVRADSGLTSAADLSGKTIAINALNSLSQFSASAAIDAEGGDSSAVKFIELPIPNMADAVAAGTVDAAMPSEPFLSGATNAGLEVLMPVYSIAIPGIPQLVYVTTQQYADDHPDIVEAFQKSITAANEQLTADPDLAKTIGLTSTDMTADVLDSIVLPVFEPPLPTAEQLTRLEKVAVTYGGLAEEFDPAPYIFAP